MSSRGLLSVSKSRSASCIRSLTPWLLAGRVSLSYFTSAIGQYRYLALARNGVAVGFPTGALSASACISTVVVVPYGAVEAYLTPFGRRLVEDAES